MSNQDYSAHIQNMLNAGEITPQEAKDIQGMSLMEMAQYFTAKLRKAEDERYGR